MAINTQFASDKIAYFLSKWPVDRIPKMTVEEYADLSDHEDSFCYLMEYDTREVGELGGMPLTKFGLWKFKQNKEYTDTYLKDSKYAWNEELGKSRTEAFVEVRRRVHQIAAAADKGDLEAIENVRFHAVAKWKIAFMYSHQQIFPVYTREALLTIAAVKKGRFAENARIVDLQRYIISQKPEDEDMISYAQYLWDHHVRGKPFRNYYIIGSKYKDENGEDKKDVFPEMLNSESVAVGFLNEKNMTHLVGAGEDEINKFVAENHKSDKNNLSFIQRYFRILLNLKSGDIIAIKSHGNYGSLKIIAYAVVVERNGSVYYYDPKKLGHHVHVEFVELDIERSFSYNYSGTLHAIESDKKEHLRAIFGPFLQVDNIALTDEPDDSEDTIHNKWKSENSYMRGPIAERMVRQLHNIIQNSFCKELEKKFPKHRIIKEYKNRVDVYRDAGDTLFFYEIKPFENVQACLRQAIGQLIEYSHFFSEPAKNSEFIIVGPGEAKGDADVYLQHYQNILRIPLSYEQHIAPNPRAETDR